jgi:hypothetical protein
MACKCKLLPRILRALTGSESKDLRPLTEWDAQGLFGLPQSQGVYPTQESFPGPTQGPLPVYGSVALRDTRPMPAAVILPVVIGYNPIPLETPKYDSGSFWAPEWERGP